MISRCSALIDQPSSTNRRRQPVEQLGVRRALAEHAEVVGRADEPLAEVPAPDAVDHHPGGQRVVRVGQPARPAPAGRSGPSAKRGGCVAGEDRREPPRHDRRRASGGCRGRGPARRSTSPSVTPIAVGSSGAAFSSAASSSRSCFSSACVSAGRALRLLRRISPGRAALSLASPRRSACDRAFCSATCCSWPAAGPVGSAASGFSCHRATFLKRLHRPGALEDPGQAVVVGRRDRVELVVVAAGAAERQAQERAADACRPARRRCPSPSSPRRPRPAPSGPSARKPVAISRSCGAAASSAAGSRSPASCSRTNWSYGLSRVERGDDVVAVAPGVAVGDVLVEAVGVGVAGDVEPVPAPALAVGGRGEQPVDDLGEGVGRVVGEEGVDLLRRRRQAGQVEGRAADQRPPVGRRRGRQARRLRAARG